MSKNLHRSARQPIRKGLTWIETWEGPDRGIIRCWERGREKRIEDPELAERAAAGELVTLPFKGGTANLEDPKTAKDAANRIGSLMYLAMWQGLRNEDLDLPLSADVSIVCSKAKREVTFRQITSSATSLFS